MKLSIEASIAQRSIVSRCRKKVHKFKLVFGDAFSFSVSRLVRVAVRHFISILQCKPLYRVKPPCYLCKWNSASRWCRVSRHVSQKTEKTDRKLNREKYIFSKRKHLGFKWSKMYWLLGRNLQLILENKILLYKTILRRIWTCGIQLWGTANFNVEIPQRYQSKILNVSWYITNDTLYRNLKISIIKEFCQRYRDRLKVHPNNLAVNLIKVGGIEDSKRGQIY